MRDDVDPAALQRAADLAPMLTYAASLAGEGKQATPYIAMLASVRGELNRIFAASSGIDKAVHSTLPAPTTEESS